MNWMHNAHTKDSPVEFATWLTSNLAKQTRSLVEWLGFEANLEAAEAVAEAAFGA